MNTVHVNIELARYSDWAFTSAVVALVIALLLLAFELAYAGGRRADARARVLAGAVSADSATPGWWTRWPAGPSMSAPAAPAWPWCTWAPACCWPAWCCAAWPPCGCRGATCTSSST